MGVVISKPAINLREQLTELKAQQGYEERQFHFDNLVTNGTFDTDTSGWTFEGTATDTSAAGYLEGTTGGATNFLAYTTISTVSGQTYVLTGDLVSGSSGRFTIGTSAGSANVASPAFSSAGSTVSVTFTAISTTSYVSVFASSANFTLRIDNVSIYTSDGTGVAFTMPKGWKPLHVYDDGVLQREGSAEDYEVTFDGFNYYVKPTVANPGARNTVIGVRA